MWKNTQSITLAGTLKELQEKQGLTPPSRFFAASWRLGRETGAESGLLKTFDINNPRPLNERIWGAQGLEGTRDPSIVKKIIDYLTNKKKPERDPNVLHLLHKTLSKSQSTDAATFLIKQAENGDLRALRSLENVKTPQAQALLLKTLDTASDTSTLTEAIHALKGHESTAVIIKLKQIATSSKDAGVQTACLETLSSFQSKDAIRFVVSIANDPSQSQLRHSAIRCLGKMTDPEATQTLATLASNNSDPFLEDIVKALEGHRDPGSVQALIALVRSKGSCADQALEYLAGSNSTSARVLCRSLLDNVDTGNYRKTLAIKVLIGSHDEKDTPYFQRAFQSSDPELKLAASIGLATLGGAQGLTYLREQLQSPANSSSIVREAMQALYRSGNPFARTLVSEALGSENTVLAQNAAQVLIQGGKSHDLRDIKMHGLTNASSMCRGATIAQLHGCKDVGIILELSKMLDKKSKTFESNNDVRCEIIKALKGTQHPAAMRALKGFISSEDPYERLLVASSLQIA